MPAQPIVRSRPKVEFTPQSDCAAAALEMVAEVAAAIRQAKEQSGQAVAQATELADSIVKKLETAEARADYAETALRNAEGEAAEWAAAATKAVEDLEIAQQQLSAKEEQLAAAERRLRYTQKSWETPKIALRRRIPRSSFHYGSYSDADSESRAYGRSIITPIGMVRLAPNCGLRQCAWRLSQTGSEPLMSRFDFLGEKIFGVTIPPRPLSKNDLPVTGGRRQAVPRPEARIRSTPEPTIS